DNAPAPVLDRKHHAVAKAVVLRAALAAGQHAGFFQQRDALRIRAERVLQRVPLVRRKAEAETLDGLRIESARLEIGARLVAAGELTLIELRRRIEQRVQVGR